ncbi:hypothetical protein MIT1002_04085 [Alteromonas macleodii]|nr:hypothetical protein MIT1002_04085 [Alteromonas macleodii]VTP56674.1 hypothetical protein MIT1002_04085 [Alteromonas macleodii]
MVIWARHKGVAISDHCDNFIYELARNEHKEKGRIHCPQHVPDELHSQHYGSKRPRHYKQHKYKPQ